jgi:hypothetical protein
MEKSNPQTTPSAEKFTFPDGRLGWRIEALGEASNYGWHGRASYGFRLREPYASPDWFFQVQGKKSRQEAIDELNDLIRKEVAKGKWTQLWREEE